MGIWQTNETKIWALSRLNRQTEIWVLRPNRPDQTKQTKIWVLSIPNGLKFGNWPDQTDQNMEFAQTKLTADRNTSVNQTEIWLLTRQISPKHGY